MKFYIFELFIDFSLMQNSSLNCLFSPNHKMMFSATAEELQGEYLMIILG